ncbi:hypothetical protein BDA96_09G159300 [Sorghum bicolor]|uniref:Uncharacterized protein n=1 Tax=Sorghum bicolor TaxID=4558 RepID=A0A921U4R2_SORBI|nr:hypothetical protein BDA96_09G159300 [Sorghum bicolor]
MRSGFRERTHEAQRRRSNPLDSRTTHPRHEHDDARAAAAAVATSMGGSSHAADIATGDSAIGPRHGPLHPGAVGTFPGNEQPADCSTHDDIAGCIMGDEDDDEI